MHVSACAAGVPISCTQDTSDVGWSVLCVCGGLTLREEEVVLQAQCQHSRRTAFDVGGVHCVCVGCVKLLGWPLACL